MHIAVGGFWHETNTFVSTPTTWDDFVRPGPVPPMVEGDAMLTAFDGLNLAVAVFMQEARVAGHTLQPLAWGCAQPSGKVTDDAYERLSASILERLKGTRPDAIFLELHGAMVSESHDDGEAEFLRRVRAIAGPDVPILASLDLHANVSSAMVRLADFYSSYRTYPHVDWGAAGGRCAQWLERVCSWKHPARALRQAPFLVPVTAGCTYIEPARGLYQTLEAIEAETGVHLSLNMGFPPADVADVGPSVIAYGADQGSVDAAADRLFDALLAAEPAFAAHHPLPVRAAVAEALRLAGAASRPIVLADTQDNPGAGAPSSTTGLIAELLRQSAQRAVVGIVHDPVAAAAAHARGIDGVVDSLGGGGPGAGQEPLPGPWRVAALSDGRFRGTSAMLHAPQTDMGPTALLSQGGVEVLVASIRQQPLHREVFTHIGVDLATRAIIGLKSSAHFRAAYQPIAERVIVCLGPGENLEDPASFPYRNTRVGVRLRPRG
jgi:microcystin degradation protein MlrC